jgi:hypothetical protein
VTWRLHGGRYAILDELGEGSLGRVFRARDLSSARAGANEESLRRAKAEVRKAQKRVAREQEKLGKTEEKLSRSEEERAKEMERRCPS